MHLQLLQPQLARWWRKRVKWLQVMSKGPVNQRVGHHEHRPTVRFEPREVRRRSRERRHIGGRPIAHRAEVVHARRVRPRATPRRLSLEKSPTTKDLMLSRFTHLFHEVSASIHNARVK